VIRAYFWRIEKRSILWAIARMALDRISLWRMSGVTFWKLLGTGKGETFTPRDADALRWGLLIVIDPNQISELEDSALLERWRTKATSEYVVDLAPISIHGEWSGKKPFAHLPHSPANWQGAVVAITRARIKWRKHLIFWRSVPPVTTSLHNSPGLKAAIGIGEAPLGLQGTFSVWESGEAVRNFAYRGEAHKAAIAATHRENWYAEEMFARFAVTKELGSL
jgi:hypothetical protein